jgi:hypothetical protein
MVAAITSSASLRFSCACSARTFAATLAKVGFRRAQACSYTVPVGVDWVAMRRGRGFPRSTPPRSNLSTASVTNASISISSSMSQTDSASVGGW